MSHLTLKIGSRSQTSDYPIALSQWYIHVSLNRVNQCVRRCSASKLFWHSNVSCALKIVSRSPNLMNCFSCPNNISVLVWPKSTHRFTRMQTMLIFTVLIVWLPYIWVKVPKSKQIFWLSQWYNTKSYNFDWIRLLFQDIGCRQAFFVKI